MTIELSPELEVRVSLKARELGLAPDAYIRSLLDRDIETPVIRKRSKSGFGMLAKYGPAPSDDEIMESRRDMLRGSIFDEEVK